MAKWSAVHRLPSAHVESSTLMEAWMGGLKNPELKLSLKWLFRFGPITVQKCLLNRKHRHRQNQHQRMSTSRRHFISHDILLILHPARMG